MPFLVICDGIDLFLTLWCWAFHIPFSLYISVPNCQYKIVMIVKIALATIWNYVSHVYVTDNVIVTDTAYIVVFIDDNRFTSPTKWNDRRMSYIGNWCGFTGGTICFVKLSALWCTVVSWVPVVVVLTIMSTSLSSVSSSSGSPQLKRRVRLHSRASNASLISMLSSLSSYAVGVIFSGFLEVFHWRYSLFCQVECSLDVL